MPFINCVAKTRVVYSVPSFVLRFTNAARLECHDTCWLTWSTDVVCGRVHTRRVHSRPPTLSPFWLSVARRKLRHTVTYTHMFMIAKRAVFHLATFSLGWSGRQPVM